MKKILYVLLSITLVIILTGCWKSSNNLGGDEPLEINTEKVITINAVNKKCIPLRLNLYDDGTYELFTAYQSCKPNQTCTLQLIYTKSIKGTYNYDIKKILDDDSIKTANSTTVDSLEYEIQLSKYYIDQGYDGNYIIEKGKKNKYLEEFLKSINVDLKVCANPEYID